MNKFTQWLLKRAIRKLDVNSDGVIEVDLKLQYDIIDKKFTYKLTSK